MCTNPLLIRNKKFQSLDVDTPRAFIQVPCGVCDECLRRRASDLYLRCDFEYRSCLKAGGCGFMCCLTYSDDVLPWLEFENIRFMVFNKKDVIDFLKRLRQNLARFYMSNFGIPSPSFKYLITSEFGTDEHSTHRPHYHLIFFFRKNISHFNFRKCFEDSLVNRKNNKRYFGRIFQCDLLDPSKGGIKYSAKYILKDLYFENQRKLINDIIKFKKDEVNQKFQIIEFPKTLKERLYNASIRKSKEYLDTLRNNVLRFSHMLQFFLCSNDLGLSSILELYGSNIVTFPTISRNGYVFALPKAARQRVAETFGDRLSKTLAKNIFIETFKQAASFFIHEQSLSVQRFELLLDFLNKFTYFESGFLFVVHPNNFKERLFDNFDFPEYNVVLYNYVFGLDNDFYSLRDDVLYIIRSFNSRKRLEVRSKVAFEKSEKENYNHSQRKRNIGL